MEVDIDQELKELSQRLLQDNIESISRILSTFFTVNLADFKKSLTKRANSNTSEKSTLCKDIIFVISVLSREYLPKNGIYNSGKNKFIVSFLGHDDQNNCA